MHMSGEFRRRFLPAVFLLLPPFLLAGCGSLRPDAPATQPEVARIFDPVAAFAADPPPSGEGQVQLLDTGETARLRVIRQYAAASGRECRELRISRRSGDQNRLFCRAGSGWIEARPLLSQAAVRQ
jgi:hypothetical protein